MTASAAGVRHRGREAHAERARQPVLGSRVHHAPLGSPVDRGLHVVGAPAQHDDGVGQAGVGDRVEGVLQEGPAVERRQQLRRPEPGARAGGQDDRDHLHPGAPVGDGRLAGPGELAHRAARAGSPFRDDLGHDRERRLGRQPPAEVEPDRAPEPVDLRLGHAGLEQPRAAVRLGLARADGPDVPAAAMRAPRRSPARRTSRRGSAPRPRRPVRGRSRRRARPATRPGGGRRPGTAPRSRTPPGRR